MFLRRRHEGLDDFLQSLQTNKALVGLFFVKTVSQRDFVYGKLILYEYLYM